MDQGQGIAVDSSTVYVTGLTQSTNFPTAQNVTTSAGIFQRNLAGGGDAFVTRFSSSGSLGFSTYLGGSGFDQGQGIAAEFGTVYLTGFTQSTNFPTAQNVTTSAGIFQRNLAGSGDAFVTRFSSSGSLGFSTYLGGSGVDQGMGIAAEFGTIYLTGLTESTNFPTAQNVTTSAGIFQRNLAGGGDAFVTRFSSSGSLGFSTYLGDWMPSIPLRPSSRLRQI